MKTIILITIAILTFSCKKERTCTCTYHYEYSDPNLNGPDGSKVESLGKITKSKAKDQCKSTTQDGSGALSNGIKYTYTLQTTCRLK